MPVFEAYREWLDGSLEMMRVEVHISVELVLESRHCGAMTDTPYTLAKETRIKFCIPTHDSRGATYE